MPDFTIKSPAGAFQRIYLPITVINPIRHLEFTMQGVLDTGCNTSSISQRLARTLNLTSFIGGWSRTSAGMIPVSFYKVDIILPQGIRFLGMDVADFVTDNVPKPVKTEEEFDILIGMDIITAGDLAITDDDGNTIVSYRKPHGPFIDFQNDGYANGVRRDEQQTIARNFKEMGIPLEQIAQGTGLTIAEIQRL
jgi:hypothetical protein